MTNSPAPTPPAPNRYNLLAVLGVFGLAVIGVALLVVAVVLLVRGPGTTSTASASPTRFAIVSTQVVLIPTTTQSPPTATAVPTEAPSATVPAPSATPPVTPTAALVIKIVKPANVRTGPGLSYPTIGGINTGGTAPLLGRDSSAQWFAISYDAAPKGTGWVSALVATFDGSINDLPVVQAAAAPPPQATAVPPTNPPGATAPPAATSTPNVSGANGIQATFSMEKTSGAVNESMWFDFTVKNTTSSAITYGILAAHTDAGFTADSWHEPLQPGQTLPWKDHINFSAPGTYQVYLGICYQDHDTCKTGGTWVKLSNSTAVTIQ
jgi:Bacterial SH3 domain